MNEGDLLEDFFRYLFASQGMSAGESEIKIIEMRQRFKVNPGKELSREEYSQKLAQMKKEAPAYLEYWQSNKFPQLPDDFFTRN